MHTKIHTGDHIRCPVCSKIFPTHAKLRAHERIHSEEVEEEREDGEDDISDYMSEGEEEDDWWPTTKKNVVFDLIYGQIINWKAFCSIL